MNTYSTATRPRPSARTHGETIERDRRSKISRLRTNEDSARVQESVPSSFGHAPSAPRTPEATPRTHKPSTRSHRLGSQQVVSVRGRQVAPVRAISMRQRLSVVAIALMVGGIAFALWLSGVATQQTFRIQQLTAQERQLDNQLESLHRDRENLSSSAEIARRADKAGLQVPVEPGILKVEENGDIVEQRPASAETRPIIDVNGSPVRPGRASSDPRGIDELGDNLESIPEGRRGIPGPDAESSDNDPAGDQAGPDGAVNNDNDQAEVPAPAPEVREQSPYGPIID